MTLFEHPIWDRQDDSCREISSDLEFAAWVFVLGSVSMVAVFLVGIRIFLEGVL